jgi:hypothetical protein
MLGSSLRKASREIKERKFVEFRNLKVVKLLLSNNAGHGEGVKFSTFLLSTC